VGQDYAVRKRMRWSLNCETSGFSWAEKKLKKKVGRLLRRRNVNPETNRVYFHDARTVTVTKKSRLAIRHWG
jgi:hypothetical protein